MSILVYWALSPPASAPRLLRAGLRALGLPPGLPRRTDLPPGAKPRLVTDETVDFNLSYTAGGVVCAVSRHWRVGIDLERHRPLSPAALSARFTAAEWALLETHPDPERAALDLWVRKEAVLKAHGSGLSVAPELVDVTQEVATVGTDRYHLRPLRLAPSLHCWLAYRPLTPPPGPPRVEIHRWWPESPDGQLSSQHERL